MEGGARERANATQKSASSGESLTEEGESLTHHGQGAEDVRPEMLILPLAPYVLVNPPHHNLIHAIVACSQHSPGRPQPSCWPVVAWEMCAMTAVREYSVII